MIVDKMNIINLLTKYEDKIMENTIGDSIDEYGERYAEYYKTEWRDTKHDIATTIESIINSGEDIVSIGFTYIIISSWSGVMCFNKGDLKIKELEKTCIEILNELGVKK